MRAVGSHLGAVDLRRAAFIRKPHEHHRSATKMYVIKRGELAQFGVRYRAVYPDLARLGVLVNELIFPRCNLKRGLGP